METGWLKLYRSMLDNYLWREKRTFSKAEAWIDILMRVNFEAGAVILNGAKIDLQPGEMATTIVHLSERWGWSRKKVDGFLNGLEKEQMVAVKRTSKYTLLTVLKWEFFQQEETEKSIKRASEEHQKSIKRAQTKKNKNNKNNKNNNIYTPYSPPEGDGVVLDFETFWSAYPRKHAKDRARKAWDKLNPDRDLLQVILKAVDSLTFPHRLISSFKNIRLAWIKLTLNAFDNVIANNSKHLPF